MSTTEFQDLSSQLQESNTIVTILGKLVSIEESRKAMELALMSNDFTQAAHKLDEIQGVLDAKVNER